MDIDSGAVKGLRITEPNEARRDDNLFVYRVFSPSVIACIDAPSGKSYVVDRATGAAWSWPADRLTPVAAAPDSRWILLEERQSSATGGMYGGPSGHFHLFNSRMQPTGAFDVAPSRFNRRVFVQPNGGAVVLSGDADDGAQTLNLVEAGVGSVIDAITLPTVGPFRPILVDASATRDVLDLTVRYDLPSGTVAMDGEAPPARRFHLPWAGGWQQVSAEAAAPQPFSASPDGRTALFATSLRHQDEPGNPLGPWEEWEALEVVVDDRPAWRVRSASLWYGDGISQNRWLADGSAFVALIDDGGERGGLGYGLFAADGSGYTRIELPPVPADHWYDRPAIRGPVPSPDNPLLLAIGHSEVFNWRTGKSVRANVVTNDGPTGFDPWSAGAGEVVFALPHLGHDGRPLPSFIAPRIDRWPYSQGPAALRMRVSAGGDCLNQRTAPSLSGNVVTCVPDATPVAIGADPSGGTFKALAFERNDAGAWVFVDTPLGERGWVSSAYLEWA